MGRPIRKENFGNPTTGERLLCMAVIDISVGIEQCWIESQRGTGKFTVNSVSGSRSGVVRLQEAAPSGLGEAQLDISAFGVAGAGSGAELSLTSIQLATPTVVAIGAGYVVGETLTVVGGTSSADATVDVNTVSTIAGQDETTIVTFTGGDAGGGTGAVALDVYTMDDGSTVRVDTIDGNDDVLTFTVLTASTSGQADLATISYASLLSGSGDNVLFDMTLTSASQGVFDVVDNVTGTYTVIPDDAAATNASAAGSGCTLNVDGEIKVIGIDEGGVDYTTGAVVTISGVTGDVIAIATVNGGTGAIETFTYTNRGSVLRDVADVTIDVEGTGAEQVSNLKQYTASTFQGSVFRWALGVTATEAGEGTVQSIDLSD